MKATRVPTDLRRRRIALAALLATMTSGLSAPAFAQAYPNKPIRLLVPFAAGGPVDTAGRVLGAKLGELMGQSFVIDNRAGGNTIIASSAVAHSPPDGYTLLLTSNQHTINPGLRQLPYDTTRDFVPISMVAVTPIFLVVHPSIPANSVKELIALLKDNPNKYFYGTSGSGSQQHITAELFKAATGTQITHVPFTGTAPSTIALVSGQVQISFATPSTTMQHVKAGKLKMLAVTTATRSQLAPDVPTLAELGIPNFDSSAWIGLFAPGGTSADTVRRIYDAVAVAVDAPEVREKLLAQGIEAVRMNPEGFSRFVQVDMERSGKIVKDAAIVSD